jgi:hypothetical protein
MDGSSSKQQSLADGTQQGKHSTKPAKQQEHNRGGGM